MLDSAGRPASNFLKHAHGAPRAITDRDVVQFQGASFFYNCKHSHMDGDCSLRHNYINMPSDEDIDTRLMQMLQNQTSKEGLTRPDRSSLSIRHAYSAFMLNGLRRRYHLRVSRFAHDNDSPSFLSLGAWMLSPRSLSAPARRSV